MNAAQLIDKNDLTVYPPGITDYDQVNEFETYENHESDSEENHKRTIQGLRKLQKFNNPESLNDLFIVTYNHSDVEDKNTPLPIRKLKTGMDEEKIYNFMFDYALIGLTKDDLLWIEYYIRKYRFVKWDDIRTEVHAATRNMICQMYFGMYLDKRQIIHIRGIWS